MTSTPVVEPAGRSEAVRLRSLDGVRGIAALVVVVHHALQLSPVFAEVQRAESAAGHGPGVWLLTHTPLHIVWAGEEAVLVFFVLSGFVLTLPALRGPVAWRSYFPRRLVRLYVPVLASLAVAVLLRAVTTPAARAGPTGPRSTWLTDRLDAPLTDVWHDALLLDGVGLLNSPLWSLRWEVVFSLLLPLYLLLLPRRRVVRLCVEVFLLLTAIGVGTLTGSHALRYLPIFGLGVVLARHRDLLDAPARRVDAMRRPGLAWALVGTLVAVLLTARWIGAALPVQSPVLEALTSGATILGAVAVVALALHWAGCATALERRPVQWLGARSFSLYLVHEPVIVAVAVLVLPLGGLWLAGVTGALAALVVTAAFYTLVEHPSIRMSRAAGRWARRRTRRPVTPATPVAPATPAGTAGTAGTAATHPEHPAPSGPGGREHPAPGGR